MEAIEKKIVYVSLEKPELRIPPPGTKWKCTKCGQIKDANPENFEPTPINSKHGRYYILRKTCRVCRHGQSREYRISHASYISAARQVARQVKLEGGEI